MSAKRAASALVCAIGAGGFCGCKTTDGTSTLRDATDDAPAAAAAVTYSTDSEGEIIPSDEVALFQTAADFIHQMQINNAAKRQQSAGDATVRRGFHAKPHACVRGTFTLADDIPADYQKGMFTTPGKTYDAWVRFSNGNPVVQADYIGDFRGFGFKVMGVDGDRALRPASAADTSEGATLDGSTDANTQDYLMLANPRMVAGTGPSFFAFTKASQLPPTEFVHYLVQHPEVAAFLAEFQLFRYFDSARFNEFFSGSAMKYGDKIVHYKVSPCAGSAPTFNLKLHAANFALVEALIKSVSQISGATAEEMALINDVGGYLTKLRALLNLVPGGNTAAVAVPSALSSTLSNLQSRVGPELSWFSHATQAVTDDFQRHLTDAMTVARGAAAKLFVSMANSGREAELAGFLEAVDGVWQAQGADLRDYLRKDLETGLRDSGACYDFSVQLPPAAALVVPPATPTQADFDGSWVENASIQWMEADSPFQKVGTLTIPPTTLFTQGPLADGMRPIAPQGCGGSANAAECACEKLNFSPWNALADQRPLGSINRIRKFVYNKSQLGRAQ